MTLPEDVQAEVERLTKPAPVPRAVLRRNEKFAHARAIARGDDMTPGRGEMRSDPARTPHPMAEVNRLLRLHEGRKGR